MKKIFLPVLVVVMAASCNLIKHSDNGLTDKEKQEGWQLLFDGKTTNGWHLYGERTAGKFWKASGGMLYPDQEHSNDFDKSQKRDLVTDDEYGNFHLKLEWRISEKGNSGIIFYVKEDNRYEASYLTGPEMQILDNGTPTRAGHSDAKIYTHRAGDLYDLLPSKEMVKPQGEWNKVEIKCVRGKLDFYMNGEHTLSTTMWDQNWKDMVEISKFKYMPDFGKFNNGRIALQYHGDAVWFRNMKIRRL